MKRPVQSALFAAPFAIGACSLLVGVDGLATGPADDEDAAVGDPPPTEGGVRDAEGGAPDAASEGGETDFCANATFCDDFERASGPLGAWDTEESAAGGSLLLSQVRAWSGSSALRVSIGAAENSNAALVHTLPPAGEIRVAYSLYLTAVPKHSDIAPLEFQFGGQTRAFVLVVDEADIKFCEIEAGGGAPTYLEILGATPVVTGRWVEVTIAMDLTVTPQRVSATYDGKSVLNHVALAKSFPSGSAARLLAGVAYSKAGAAYELDLDAVRADVAAP